MSLYNLTSALPLYNNNLQDQEEQDPEYSTGGALANLLTTVCVIGEIVMGSLGIAGTLHDSETTIGWTIAPLAAASVLIPAIKFFRSSKISRTQQSFTRYVVCPLFSQTAPLVCGVLTGTGYLSAHTTGLVTVGVVSGVCGMGCCCIMCLACSSESIRRSGDSGDSGDSGNQDHEELERIKISLLGEEKLV